MPTTSGNPTDNIHTLLRFMVCPLSSGHHTASYPSSRQTQQTARGRSQRAHTILALAKDCKTDGSAQDDDVGAALAPLPGARVALCSGLDDFWGCGVGFSALWC